MNTLPNNEQTEERIPITCCLDCGSRCELLAVRRGGRLVRIDTPERNDPPDMPRLIPCARGRAQRRLLSSTERVTHPMKRIGPPEDGRFERIEWDNALDIIAEKLQSVRTQHSAAAVLAASGPGAAGSLGISGSSAARRFFSFWDGVTVPAGNMSSHCVHLASGWMFGRSVAESDRATLLDSRLIVLWSMNPAETLMGPNGEKRIIMSEKNRGLCGFDESGKVLWKNTDINGYAVCPVRWTATDGRDSWALFRPQLKMFNDTPYTSDPAWSEGLWPGFLDGDGALYDVLPWREEYTQPARLIRARRSYDCGVAYRPISHDVDSDGLDEIVVHDRDQVWVFHCSA